MIDKIFYKLSPGLLEKVIISSSDTFMHMEKSGADYAELSVFGEEVKKLILIFLTCHVMSREISEIVTKFLVHEDLEQIRLIPYNYNKCLLLFQVY